MDKTLPDFNELVASLAKRGVNVSVTGRYSHRKEQMSYVAELAMDALIALDTWPRFAFKVYGRELNELAEDISARLPLVEPIIAACEKRRQHADAISEASRIGAELAAICIPAITPNTDPKTAKGRPVKTEAVLGAAYDSVRATLRTAERGDMSVNELREREGLPPLAA